MNTWAGITMADGGTAYKRALVRREELLRELAEVEEFVRLYEKLFTENSTPENSDAPHYPRRRRRRNILSPDRIAQMARDIIIEAGRPMTRSEIARELEAKGVPLVGVDKVKNIGTILWRHQNTFVRAENGYWVAEVPLPDKPTK